MAAKAQNGVKCVEVLLDAWLTVDKTRRDAGLKRKDGGGKTPYDVATGKARAVIDEWLREPETESEDEAVGEAPGGSPHLHDASRGAAAVPSKFRRRSRPAGRGAGRDVDIPWRRVAAPPR